MARKGPAALGRRSLYWLTGLVVLLVLVLVGGNLWWGASWAPKLALDLEGGTQMILEPKVEGNKGAITDEQLNQAVSIIRQRVDGSGVSEAQISTQNTTSGKSVVVALPGTPSAEQRNLIKASANMSFRPVLTAAQGVATPAAQMVPDAQLPKPTAAPTSPTDPNWIDGTLYKQFEAFACTQEAPNDPDPAKPTIACDPSTGMKYILGPVAIKGQEISSATAGLKQLSQGATSNEWAVNLTLNDEGTRKFADISKVLYGIYQQNPQDPRAQFAIVLDGKVLSAPVQQAVITDGKSQISGNFTQESAKALSDQLKYGALPISFNIQSEEQVSATLGTQQLEMGILAGLIGLILVVIYSLFQYRLLGLVTIASLVVAGVLTYLAIAMLGWAQGYRLSLAGVAGLIVSIGQTADSFIVYFERIRDELREGRGLVAAVANGWQRARRTILASKAVNLLAALVLYFVAVGNVQGFAFTLGLTAIADLLVVFLFTHPMLQILSKVKFFAEGHRFSGLSPDRLGAVPLYRGAGRVRTSSDATSASDSPSKKSGANREAQRRLSIAERRYQEQYGKALDDSADAVVVDETATAASGASAKKSGGAKDSDNGAKEQK